MASFRGWMLGVLGLLLPLLRILCKEKGISGIMGNNLKTKNPSSQLKEGIMSTYKL